MNWKNRLELQIGDRVKLIKPCYPDSVCGAECIKKCFQKMSVRIGRIHDINQTKRHGRVFHVIFDDENCHFTKTQLEKVSNELEK